MLTVIIDGYNLLKRLFGQQVTRERERDQALRTIQRRADARGYAAIIVFDGGSTTMRATEQRGMLSVVMAGYGRTADDEIVALVRSRFDVCVVVTADNQLARAIHRPTVVVIDPSDFWGLIRQPAPPLPVSMAPVELPPMGADLSLDELMERAAQLIRTPKAEDVGMDFSGPRVAPAARLSRRERWVESIVARL